MTTRDYGFDDTYAMDGRIQETLLMIYDWFAGNTNPNITVEPGAGISSETLGPEVQRRSVLPFHYKLDKILYQETRFHGSGISQG